MPSPAAPNFAVAWSGYGAVPTPRAADAATLQQLHGDTMGTRWSLRWVNAEMRPLAEVRALVQTQLDAVIAQMSHWEPDSVISRFNQAPAATRHTLPAEFAEVMQAAWHWAQTSGGAFDPAAGQLVALWGFGPHAAPATTLPPDQQALASWRHGPHWPDLALIRDAQGTHITQPGGLWLDLSGIAKGYAVDLVTRALQAQGIHDFLVDIGGELRASGRRPDGQPWRIQAGLDSPGQPAPVLALHAQAVATSGSAWHHHSTRGQDWSHTVDPRTGEACQNPLATVTVLHAECLHADALATVLWVLGPEDGLAFAEQHQLAARLQTRTGAVRTSRHWPAEVTGS